MEKNLGGRPTKLTEKFLQVAENVLKREDIVFYTDEELFEEINDNLTKDERIHINTFKHWKKFALQNANNDEVDEEIKESFVRFLYLLKKLVRNQKSSLHGGMMKDSNWTRYAWILERKFDELNLKSKQHYSGELGITSQVEQTTFSIKPKGDV